MDNGQLYNIPNTWGFEALESLNKVIDIVEKDKDIKGWILTGKPYIFNVGADIMSVDPTIKRDEAVKIGATGHAAFKRIMNLKIPTLAAINGAAMGGGVEVGFITTTARYPRARAGVIITRCPSASSVSCRVGAERNWSPSFAGRKQPLS